MSENGPEWQEDDEVSSCFLCDQKYTFFNRRHHCRKCGKVVCNQCSTQSVRYFPNTAIVNGPHQRPVASSSYSHKTCDACVEEIRMIRRALYPSEGGEVSTNSSQTSLQLASTTKYASRQRTFLKSGTNSVRDDDSDANLCPICATNLVKLYKHNEPFEDFKEAHINDCLVAYDFSHEDNVRSGTGSTKNKMLVFNMQPIPDPKIENIGSLGSSIGEHEEREECVICLEEMNPGDKVGRLECLCVFHYACIKSWFNRGNGECPVHFLHKHS